MYVCDLDQFIKDHQVSVDQPMLNEIQKELYQFIKKNLDQKKINDYLFKHYETIVASLSRSKKSSGTWPPGPTPCKSCRIWISPRICTGTTWSSSRTSLCCVFSSHNSGNRMSRPKTPIPCNTKWLICCLCCSVRGHRSICTGPSLRFAKKAGVVFFNQKIMQTTILNWKKGSKWKQVLCWRRKKWRNCSRTWNPISTSCKPKDLK